MYVEGIAGHCMPVGVCVCMTGNVFVRQRD